MSKKTGRKFSEFNFELSYLVTSARLWSGLTQAQLARKVGTKQPAIARLEGGSLLPSWKVLEKIAQAIGTELIPPRFEFMDGNFSMGREDEGGAAQVVVVHEQDEHGCIPSTYKQAIEDSAHKTVEVFSFTNN